MPWVISMSLSSAQERAAVILLASGTGRIALAGGGALIAQGLVERRTSDLDGFTSAAGQEFTDIVRQARAAFSGAGYRVRDDPNAMNSDEIYSWKISEQSSPGRGRTPDEVKIQICRDVIALPPVPTPLGQMLDPRELGANKVRAIYDRARPRDLDDLARLVSRLPFDDMLGVADQKQVEPLDRRMLADSLRMFQSVDGDRFPDPARAAAVKNFGATLADQLVAGGEGRVVSPYDDQRVQPVSEPRDDDERTTLLNRLAATMPSARSHR